MGKDKVEMFAELVRTVMHDELQFPLINGVTYLDAKKYEAAMKEEYLKQRKQKQD